MDNLFQYQITFGPSPVNTGDVESFLRQVSCGAEVIFQGVVRNDQLGNQDEVIAIEYEGIEGMIESEVKKIALDLHRTFKIHQFYFHHIIGKVAVGQASIWVGISGGHRKEVFAALDNALDQIKTTVPIFKKEMGKFNQQWK